MSCKHCAEIERLAKDSVMTNREYWLLTEFFVYLHGGKDYCDSVPEIKIT